MLPCQKNLFTLPEGQHYLNCAYMSPLSKRVEAAGLKGLLAKRAPASIGANDFFDTSIRVRDKFGELVNAPAKNMALIPAASYGLAIAAKNTQIGKGQEILMLEEQFPSNVYTWMRLAETSGAHLNIIKPPTPAANRGHTWNQRILEGINKKTAIVALAPVHWADGTLFDLEAIGRRAREVGAAFIVDGTQSVGALPFDVETILPDALICAGYKWLMGPYSTGIAYLGPRYLNGTPLEENWINRKNSENFGGLVQYTGDYQPGAIRFDVGERSNFTLLPMLDAALSHLLEWGVHNIQAYCSALVDEFCQKLIPLGYGLETKQWRASHLFGVRVRSDLSMERLMEAISAANISVSRRGNAIRVSPHVYNDATDLEALARVFIAAAKNG